MTGYRLLPLATREVRIRGEFLNGRSPWAFLVDGVIYEDVYIDGPISFVRTQRPTRGGVLIRTTPTTFVYVKEIPDDDQAS